MPTAAPVNAHGALAAAIAPFCGNFTVGPLAAAQYTYVSISGFSEQGSLLSLQIHSDSQDSFRTDLGVQATYAWHCGSVLLIPSVTAAWKHEYLYSALPITVSSVQFPGATATFFGPNEGHDSAIINAGIGTQWTPRNGRQEFRPMSVTRDS
jgi:outer membrane autotransporter protein